MTTRFEILILAVSDLDRSVRFYQEAFSLVQVVDTPVYVELLLTQGLRLGLYQREGFGRNVGKAPAAVPAGDVAGTELYFFPEDLPDTIWRLQQAGARLLSPLARRIWGDEAAYFTDPDGFVLVVARRGGEG